MHVGGAACASGAVATSIDTCISTARDIDLCI
jgi:hypothetical protein